MKTVYEDNTIFKCLACDFNGSKPAEVFEKSWLCRCGKLYEYPDLPTPEQIETLAAFETFSKFVDILLPFTPEQRVDILDRILIFHGYKAIPK